RGALRALGIRAVQFRQGLGKLADQFASRGVLLRTAIDANQASIMAMIDGLSDRMRKHEQEAQARFDYTLTTIYRRVAIIAIVFLSSVVIIGIVVARSIRLPLYELMTAMHAIVSGNYRREIQGINAKDEVGAMARAVEVFRENAIAKQKAEDELRASKE